MAGYEIQRRAPGCRSGESFGIEAFAVRRGGSCLLQTVPPWSGQSLEERCVISAVAGIQSVLNGFLPPRK